jgi:hypothetical protein
MLTKNTEQLRIEVRDHLAADAVVRGRYWEDGKGCFIGCLAHSDDPELAFERFGLPIAVLRIAEGIFEALPDDEGRAFFAALPDAVGRDGKDLSRVHWAFLASELRALPKVSADLQAVIDPVIAGMDILSIGGVWDKDAAYAYAAAADAAADAAARAARAAYAAADAAYAAAYAADAGAYADAYAADAAAYAADAADAAARAADAADDAARAAARAAYVAGAYADAARATYADADAARAAAYAAARAAVRLRQRDTLLRLISEAV